MMIRSIILFIVVMSFSSIAGGQEQQPPTGRDTTSVLPRLEIPEITIVGRKAITLPFARKGEIYDVPHFDAPQPDSTLLGARPGISLPIGSLPRYEEQLLPWRASVEGSIGSFTTGSLHGYVDYKTQRWGIYGDGGFRRTSGHTANADASETRLGVNAHSLVDTDNDILRSFRASGGLTLDHDAYSLFGLPGIPIDRERSNVNLNAQVGSVDRRGNVLDVGLTAKVWSVTDITTLGDSDVSVVSPDLHARFSSDLRKDVRLSTIFSYTGSSLNFDQPVQSPSLVGLAGDLRFRFTEDWLLLVGAIYQSGSGSDGASRSLVAPQAALRWGVEQDRTWSFWFQPELRLAGYGDHIGRNPYLDRELVIKPERRAIQAGTTFEFKDRTLSIAVTGAFARSDDRPVTVADSLGRMQLEYVDANEFLLEGTATIGATDRIRFQISGTIQPASERGTSTQLPMLPVVRLGGRGEIELTSPITVWSSIDYLSKRNIDLVGETNLGDIVLLGTGVSFRVIPNAVISLDVANLLNSSYDWWRNYSAPGRQITLAGKLHVK